MRKLFLICVLQVLAAPAFAAAVQTDTVMNALTKELDRSFGVLKTAEKTPLYFLGYEVIDTNQYSVSSFMGAIDSENDSQRRRLDIEARFNDYNLDNTHQVKGDNSYSYPATTRSTSRWRTTRTPSAPACGSIPTPPSSALTRLSPR